MRRIAGSRLTLSTVICTKDRPRELRRVLLSIAQQVQPPDEVVVVNGGGKLPDWCLDPVRGHPGLSIRETATGLTHQRNEGLRAASGDLVVFIDDDVVLRHDCLRQLADAAQREDDCSVQVFQPHVIDVPPRPDGGRSSAAARLLLSVISRAFLLPTNGQGHLKRSGFAASPLRVHDARLVHVVCGCGFALRRHLAARVRFDEELRGYAYMEDVDFSRQVAALGAKTRMVPDALLWHRRSPSLRADARTLGRMKIRNHWHLYRKHSPRRPVDRLAFGWSLFGLLLVSVVRGKPAELVGTAEQIVVEAATSSFRKG